MREPLPIPFGRYELVERLAVGGMAEVYVATVAGEAGFAKKVVIKRLLPHLGHDPIYQQMFIDEAKLTARLVHPKIAQTYELGRHGNELFITMEHIDGFDVLSMLRECAQRREQLEHHIAAWIAREVLDALDFAHQAPDEQGNVGGVVHRDISPSNVILSVRGDVKLIDFGIARAHDPSKPSTTKSGTLKGKYGYMSPEQVVEQPLDPRTDLFSVGVVLAEMLTGRRLFAAANELDVLLMVRDAKLSRLDKYGEGIDPGLDVVVRKALKKNPEDRWATAGAFRDAIDEWLFMQRRRVAPKMIADLVAVLRDGILAQRQRDQAAELPGPSPAPGEHAGEQAAEHAGEQAVGQVAAPMAQAAGGRAVMSVPSPTTSALSSLDSGDSLPMIAVSYDDVAPMGAPAPTPPPALARTVTADPPAARAGQRGLVISKPKSAGGLPIVRIPDAAPTPAASTGSEPVVQSATDAPASDKARDKARDKPKPVTSRAQSDEFDLGSLDDDIPPTQVSLGRERTPSAPPPSAPVATGTGVHDLGEPAVARTSTRETRSATGTPPNVSRTSSQQRLTRDQLPPPAEGRVPTGQQVPPLPPPAVSRTATSEASPGRTVPPPQARTKTGQVPPTIGRTPTPQQARTKTGQVPPTIGRTPSSQGPAMGRVPTGAPGAQGSPAVARTASTVPPSAARVPTPQDWPQIGRVSTPERGVPVVGRATTKSGVAPGGIGERPLVGRAPTGRVAAIEGVGKPRTSTIDRDRGPMRGVDGAPPTLARTGTLGGERPPTIPRTRAISGGDGRPVIARTATFDPEPGVASTIGELDLFGEPPGGELGLGDADAASKFPSIEAAIESLMPMAGGQSREFDEVAADNARRAVDLATVQVPDTEEALRRRPPTPPTIADIADDPDESGDFADTPPLTVLFRLMTHKATGLLTVAVGGIKKEIFFREGQPEYVSSNVASELFGSYLVSKGVMSDGELAMALAMMPHYGGKLGDTLVGLGLLKPLEVFRHLTRQVRSKIIDVCTWNKGLYGWYAGRENLREAFPLDLNTYEVLGAGAMALPIDTLDAWIEAFRDKKLRAVRSKRVGPDRFEIYRLAEVFDSLDGRRTVGEILDATGDKVERTRTARLLYLLECVESAKPSSDGR